VFVGVDWERTGGPPLLEAFRRVRAQVPDATLTIVGCRPPVSEPGVDVVGRVPLSEVWRYYAEATVFCMPTRWEPFGIVYLEAMMQRLPVVATRVGAIPDFVSESDNGFLVGVDDVDGMARRLIQLLRNPELCREMGKRGFCIAQRYSWDHAADIMVTAINRHVPL
jgi:glycosyltransferase involved in cell wall biosynthesis